MAAALAPEAGYSRTQHRLDQRKCAAELPKHRENHGGDVALVGEGKHLDKADPPQFFMFVVGWGRVPSYSGKCLGFKSCRDVNVLRVVFDERRRFVRVRKCPSTHG